jgi:hypothetical protein
MKVIKINYVVMWCVYVRLGHVGTDDYVFRKLVERSNEIAVIRIIGTSRPYNVAQIRYAVEQYVPMAYIIVYKWQRTGACCHRPSVHAGKMKVKVTDISVKWNLQCYRELKQDV